MIQQILLLIYAVCLFVANGSAFDRTFVLRNVSRDLNEFRAFVKLQAN
jgi:hypothetical protein